jgi:hypothetical protein
MENKMSKIEFKVTQNGKPFTGYNWNEITRTFSTYAHNLVIDFGENEGITFNTGSNCNFKTGHSCYFKTGHSCYFNTGHSCTFETGHSCTFETGYGCNFKMGKECVIIRGDIEENKTIKLNMFLTKGFTYIKRKSSLLMVKIAKLANNLLMN